MCSKMQLKKYKELNGKSLRSNERGKTCILYIILQKKQQKNKQTKNKKQEKIENIWPVFNPLNASIYTLNFSPGKAIDLVIFLLC